MSCAPRQLWNICPHWRTNHRLCREATQGGGFRLHVLQLPGLQPESLLCGQHPLCISGQLYLCNSFGVMKAWGFLKISINREFYY